MAGNYYLGIFYHLTGYTPQENGISKEEIYFSTPEDKVPIGRGFGLSKMTGAQQWQKSNFTILSVNAENQFSLGVGRGELAVFIFYLFLFFFKGGSLSDINSLIFFNLLNYIRLPYSTQCQWKVNFS